MNYAGHEKLRADVAEVANTMCDLRARLNDMEHRCRFDSDVLVERLICRENGGFPRIATSVSLPGKNGCGI